MPLPKDYWKPWGTPLLLKSLAVVLAYVSWAFSMGIANSRSWRVWEFNSQSIAVMYIGLWETYYVETFNVTGLNLNVSVSAKLNASWGIPDEIYYGQDLLLLANFLAPVALVFSTLAVWASWTRSPYPLFFRSCYNTAAVHLFLSCFCLTLTVAWNFIVDLFGQTTLEFPQKFPVSKEMISSKRISYVLPLGVLACIFSLVGAIIFVMDSCAMEEEKEEEPKLLMPMV
ncbi:uncharacterized protein LOC106694620 [Myotis lucifugus]|uniref:uncharacterized protein LOC106694620 n=1 Tax=Myotis lucifugus TaxID=59463 RepID=UPI0006D71555|nr:uncharacterized protein LOC106694620 [Myotis lucifugus]